LVTPARNEEALIEGTILSVVAQTVKPVRWIVVSDGSTDRTDSIVRKYVAQHTWMELLRMPERSGRDFAAKANAFRAGYAQLSDVSFDIIGNLDADITFNPNYYEFLMAKFGANEHLGVAGTPFVEDASRPDRHSYAGRFANLEHVSGGCQMFRRTCFETVGGYSPIKGGGIDWVAVTTARMKGWQTQTFTEKVCFHHRMMGTASRGPIRARFRHGQEDYYVGHHPLWELLRGVFQMKESPMLLGGVSLLVGYLWAWTTRVNRPVSQEIVAFHRREQLARLRHLAHRRRARA